MPVNSSNTFNEVLRHILAPVVRYCLKRGLKLQDLIEAAKHEFVEQACLALQNDKIKTSDSKISIMTGVHRKDISSFRSQDGKKTSCADLVTRVIARWQTDSRFLTKNRRPRTLRFGSEHSEFATLVSAVSKEVNPYTVLFELERIAAIKKTSKGLRLVKKIYVPVGDWRQGVEFLSTDIDDLICAVDANLFDPGELPNLHIKTQYDAIPQAHVGTVRQWLLMEGSSFHKRVRDYLASLDCEQAKEAKNTNKVVRVCVGSFGYIDENIKDEFHENK